MKTFSAKANEVPRKWWIIDAKDQVLGQVAVKAANLLRGKEKAIFTPHVDTGDFVVVINAEKVRVTGKKEEQKSFMSFSGFVGGHKSENVKARRARHPELLVERAVRGMIPHNRLGRAVYRKLKVYNGDEHPHGAQQPARGDSGLTELFIMANTEEFIATGRRKTAVARIRMTAGSGKIDVNGKSFEDYFPTVPLQNTFLAAASGGEADQRLRSSRSTRPAAARPARPARLGSPSRARCFKWMPIFAAP